MHFNKINPLSRLRCFKAMLLASFSHNYIRKTLYLRRLTRFWTRMWLLRHIHTKKKLTKKKKNSDRKKALVGLICFYNKTIDLTTKIKSRETNDILGKILKIWSMTINLFYESLLCCLFKLKIEPGSGLLLIFSQGALKTV